MPAADAARARRLTAVAFEIPGPSRSGAAEVPITSTTPASSTPRPRRSPLQIEVDNPGGELLIGQAGTAILYTAGTERDAGGPEGRRC